MKFYTSILFLLLLFCYFYYRPYTFKKVVSIVNFYSIKIINYLNSFKNNERIFLKNSDTVINIRKHNLISEAKNMSDDDLIFVFNKENNDLSCEIIRKNVTIENIIKKKADNQKKILSAFLFIGENDVNGKDITDKITVYNTREISTLYFHDLIDYEGKYICDEKEYKLDVICSCGDDYQFTTDTPLNLYVNGINN